MISENMQNNLTEFSKQMLSDNVLVIITHPFQIYIYGYMQDLISFFNHEQTDSRTQTEFLRFFFTKR